MNEYDEYLHEFLDAPIGAICIPTGVSVAFTKTSDGLVLHEDCTAELQVAYAERAFIEVKTDSVKQSLFDRAKQSLGITPKEEETE